LDPAGAKVFILLRWAVISHRAVTSPMGRHLLDRETIEVETAA